MARSSRVRFIVIFKMYVQHFFLDILELQRPLDPFPFIIKSTSNMKSKGFWGLVFDVDQKGLAQLDFYEGMLYSRIPVSVLYSDGNNDRSNGILSNQGNNF